MRTIHKISRKLKAAQHGKTKDPKNEKLDKKIIKMTEELRMLKVSGHMRFLQVRYHINVRF